MSLRLITNLTNNRTIIGTLIPKIGLGHTAALISVNYGQLRSEGLQEQQMNRLGLQHLQGESE